MHKYLHLILTLSLPGLSLLAVPLLVLLGRAGRRTLVSVLALALAVASMAVVAGSGWKFIEARRGASQAAGHTQFVEASIPWFTTAPAGAGAPASPDSAITIDLGILADEVSAIMLMVLAGIACAAHLLVYFAGRGRNTGDVPAYRQHALIAFSTFAFAGTLAANNLMLLLVLWELAAAAAYLFGLSTRGQGTVSRDRLRRFVVERVGSTMMLAGIAVLFSAFGSFRFSVIIAGLVGMNSAAPTIGAGELTVAGLLLAAGVMVRIAQFPLHTQLTDPNGVPLSLFISNLLFSLTVGAAVLARLSFLFTSEVLFVVGVIGAVTAPVCAALAAGQSDVRRIVALLAVAHGGFILMMLGAGVFDAAVLNIVVGAMAYTVLFLCVGAIGLRGRDEREEKNDSDLYDLRRMGGLGRSMKTVYLVMLPASLAVSAFTAGYTAIATGGTTLRNGLSGNGMWGDLSLPVSVCACFWVGLTAYALLRMVLHLFHGPARDTGTGPGPGMRIVLVVVVLPLLWFSIGHNPFNMEGDRIVRAVRAAHPLPLGVVIGREAASGSDSGTVRMRRTDRSMSAMMIARRSRYGMPLRFPAPILLACIGAGALLAVVGFMRRGRRGQLSTGRAARGVVWLEQNILGGAGNLGIEAARRTSRGVALLDTSILDGAARFVAGGTQFLGLLARQLQVGRIQYYLLFMIVAVLLLFFLLR